MFPPALLTILHHLGIGAPAFLLLRVLLIVYLWIGLLPPAVHAFPFPASSLPYTVSSSFRFSSIPYHDAIQHIHSPEHLETIQNLPRNYFRIRRVAQPVRYGDFVTVSADCLIQNIPHTLCLLARPDQNSTCTYMCLQGAVQRAEISLRVRQNNKIPSSSQGHILTMETTYFARGKRVLDNYLDPTIHFLAQFENRTQSREPTFSSPPSPSFKPHPNLLWYRRMVLGLPGTPDRWL